jgi:hypothetical protein
MDVVRHQHVAMHMQLMMDAGEVQHGQKDHVVSCALEDLRSIVASLNHVLCQSNDLQAFRASHGRVTMHEP